MEFLYDGSHIVTKSIEEDKLFEYSHGITIWVAYNGLAEEKSMRYYVKQGEEMLWDSKSIREANAYVNGMIDYAAKVGVNITKIDSSPVNLKVDDLENEELREVVRKQAMELMKIKKDKEKAELLARKLANGILKDKAKGLGSKLESILVEHVDSL